MKTVIVGGVAAGASTGARLRRLDESAEIVVLERDHYVSFANCGLPYHIGGAIPDRDSLLLQTPESLARSLALDVRTGQDVIRIDRDAREVEVRDLAQRRTYRESYDKLVLCLGAEPIRPPIPGADDPRVDVLRNIPDMDRIITQLDKDATSAVIVGGSYIGLELTEAFRTRGLATTVVERTERLMPWLDPEMTRILDYHVRTHDVDLRLGTSATAVRHGDGGRLVVDLSDGTSVEADVVVMAAGARPNVALARDAGGDRAARRDRGRCPDAHLSTGHPRGRRRGGDRALADRGAGAVDAGRPGRTGRAGSPRTRSPAWEDVGGYRGTQGTAVVKVFDMTAGGTGLTETELRAAGMDYRKVYTHQNGHAAYYPGTAPLFLKVLFDPAGGKLLGAQVLGWDGVDKRIDVLAVAIRAGMTVYDLEHLELAYAPPYGAAKDPVNMAGFLGANLLRGDIDVWYPEDYPDCAGRVTILDVRTPAEYEAWHIPGAVLLPYTELRQRLAEVPRDKPVYTYCRSGFRSYIAYCVLKQNGWDDVAFLSGGMMTYHGYHRTPLTVGQGGMPMVAYAEDELAQRPGALEHV